MGHFGRTLEGMEKHSFYYKFDMSILLLAWLPNSCIIPFDLLLTITPFDLLLTQNPILLKFPLSFLAWNDFTINPITTCVLLMKSLCFITKMAMAFTYSTFPLFSLYTFVTFACIQIIYNYLKSMRHLK
jgi:hypothetical protein